MKRAIRGLLLLSLLAASTACAGAASTSGTPRPRPRNDLITQEEMRRGQWASAYEMVKALRSRWLQSRGVDTINGRPGEVQVHLDDTRMGGVESLRSIPVVGIEYLQFFDPISAAGRWGLDHGHGAIYISTRPR